MVYFRSCPPGRRRAEAMDIEVGAVNCTGQGQDCGGLDVRQVAC